MAATVSRTSQLEARSARRNRVARVSAKASRAKRDRTKSDGATYLSMYFRDMAVLDVLRPEEEFTAAREIEALEILLWEAVLSYPPAIEPVLAAVAAVPDYHVTPEV